VEINGQTDGQTDATDYFTFSAKAVGRYFCSWITVSISCNTLLRVWLLSDMNINTINKVSP